jgi:hypothetical protein
MAYDYYTYNRWFAVTPSDTVDITERHSALVVGAAGTLAIVDPRNLATIITVVAGQVLPVQVRRVNATGTTATGIVALCHV